MRVYEVAKEFEVPAKDLIHLLREMGVAARSEGSKVDASVVAKLRARIERERRAGRESADEVIEAVMEDVHSGPRRRRRRRRERRPATPETETSASPTADAAEAIAAEKAEEAAERDADLVTTGAESPKDTTIIVEEPTEETVEEMVAEDVEAAEEAAAEAEEAAEAKPKPIPVVPVAEDVEAEAEAEVEAEAEEEVVAEEEDDDEPRVRRVPKPVAPGRARRARKKAPEPVVEEETPEPVAEEPAEEVVAEEEPEAEPVAAEADEEEPAEDEPAPVEAEAEPEEPKEPAPKRKPARRRRPRRVTEGIDLPTTARPAPRRGRTRPAAPAASAGPGGDVRIQTEGRTPSRRRKGRRRGRRRRVDQGAVQDNIQRVMAELQKPAGGRRRRPRRQEPAARREQEAEIERRAAEEAKTVRVNEFLTVAELAELIDRSATDIITSAFKNLGLMVTINQRLDFDQIELLLDEFGFQAAREEEYGVDLAADEVEEDDPESLHPRPPIITVMGHVDHGKTSLLDYIRAENVIAGESGGITQHIGAYHVTLDDGRSLSFLDTPGHAAFTAMRARGAEVTDIVVLVIAADDAVMPQTIEAISHAKNAGVPIIVAINKVDLPTADPMRVKQLLLQHEVVIEEFGGDVLVEEVSAKTGHGMDDLLDKILLQAEILELQANPDRDAQGTVVEAQLDIGKGPVATVLVTNGTLRVGDSFVCGLYDGRVRALLDERGNNVEEAGPAVPVQVLGLSGVPQAGDILITTEAERAADISQTRQRLEREKQIRIRGSGVKLTDLSRMLAEGEASELNLIIKGDVDGSVQALSDSLEELSTSEVSVDVVHRAVGAINESDVLLAATSGAIIIGFHVRPTSDARIVADREDIDIRLYSIIYEAVEDVRKALEGMLEPEEREVLLGVAEIRQIFKIPRVGTVGGCYVTEGTIERRGLVRVVRDDVQIYEGELGSLKRFKDDVREVREGFECGLNVANYNDIKVGDKIECYRIEEVARTLAGSAEDEQGT